MKMVSKTNWKEGEKEDYLSLRQASSRESPATARERHVRAGRTLAASMWRIRKKVRSRSKLASATVSRKHAPSRAHAVYDMAIIIKISVILMGQPGGAAQEAIKSSKKTKKI